MTDTGLPPRPKESRAATASGQRILIGSAALLYLVFLVEAYLGHYTLLGEPRYWPTWIPLLYSPLALLVCLAAMLWPGRLVVILFRTFMWLSLGIGLLGLYFHGLGFVEEGWWGLFLERRLGGPPVPAPLSYVLPGMIGLAAGWGNRPRGGRE